MRTAKALTLLTGVLSAINPSHAGMYRNSLHAVTRVHKELHHWNYNGVVQLQGGAAFGEPE